MNSQATLKQADVQIVDTDAFRMQVRARLLNACLNVTRDWEAERNETQGISLMVDGVRQSFALYQLVVKGDVVTYVYLYRFEGSSLRERKHYFALIFVDPDGSPHCHQDVYEAVGHIEKVAPKSYKDFLSQA